MYLDLLRQRRSIRQFSSAPIPDEQLTLLQEAILRSPSSRGLDPWQFIFVSEPELLQQLAAAKPHGAAFLSQAQLAVVVCADPERCDVWVEDCAIAAFSLQLAATDLGLASCWAQIRCREHDETCSAEDYVRQVVNLPDTLRVDSIIGIGAAAEQKAGHPRENLRWERIHHQHYQAADNS